MPFEPEDDAPSASGALASAAYAASDENFLLRRNRRVRLSVTVEGAELDRRSK